MGGKHRAERVANGRRVLSSGNQERTLHLAHRLEQLGCSPNGYLEAAVFAEEELRKRFEVREGMPWLKEGVLEEMLRGSSGKGIDRDVIYSPTLLRILAGLRLVRTEVGTRGEQPDFDLDDLAAAIAMKPVTGRKTAPRREQQQDRIDYGSYLRIRRVLASVLGKPRPKPGKLASLSLIELSWTKEEFEPHLSSQISAYHSDKKRGRVSLSDRAALVLLGTLRGRRGNNRAVADNDLDEARNEVARLEHSLRRIGRRESP